MNYPTEDYTFDGLSCPLGSVVTDPERCPSLCYMVSLINSPTHAISDTIVAKRIISWLYEFEEQAVNAEHLKVGEGFFKRYFEGGFYPQTPCMITKQWSPISALLESGFYPRVLNREIKARAVATGIWDPPMLLEATKPPQPVGDFFWSIMEKVSRLAVERKMWISVIAEPGWDYTAAISSLPDWPIEEVEKSGRILWKRTPEG